MSASLLERVLCGQHVLVDDHFRIGPQCLNKGNKIADAVLVDQLVTPRIAFGKRYGSREVVFRKP